MRKILVGMAIASSLASCQYVGQTIDAVKTNVKNSLGMPNLFPSVDLKQNIEDKKQNDLTHPFSLSGFFKQKFDL